MIISLFCDDWDKEFIVNKLKEKYKDKLNICDFFEISFKNLVDNERFKYQLMNKYGVLESNVVFSNYINKITLEKIDNLFKCNKDKINILIVSNLLCNINYFYKSNLKILITSKKGIDKIFENFIDNIEFDYVIKAKDIDKVRKLVNLL